MTTTGARHCALRRTGRNWTRCIPLTNPEDCRSNLAEIAGKVRARRRLAFVGEEPSEPCIRLYTLPADGLRIDTFDGPKIGDTVADGTVYAGISPDTGTKMYTLPADGPRIYTFDEAGEYARRANARKEFCPVTGTKKGPAKTMNAAAKLLASNLVSFGQGLGRDGQRPPGCFALDRADDRLGPLSSNPDKKGHHMEWTECVMMTRSMSCRDERPNRRPPPLLPCSSSAARA